MSVINCKMCGGDIELSEDRTYGTCEYCGCTMTLPKMDGEQTAVAFNRGNQFRRMGEFDKALAVYERIVEQDDSNAEAHWCCALCRFGIEYVEDPETHDWIPTCHRASFDSILEDVDYLAAVEHSDGVTRKQYQRDGAKIAQVQKAVLAASQQEEPFDVFLCYKESEEDGSRTKDSALAQDIYYQLTDQGRRVFFARITLEDKGGAEYEPYIFAALQSAKVMVVVGTSAAHLNAVWVKNEWSRFLALMKQDRSKLLLPCYRDMDPYDLPEQLSILQSYDMSKIGFIQDLIRGISKVLDAGKEKEPEKAKETVIVQGKGGNLEALLQRGDIALEDGEWKKADGFYEQALNLDADEPRAYLGKFLAEQKQPTLEKLAEARAALHTVEPAALEACPEDVGTIKRIVRENSLEGYYTPADNLFPFDRTYPANAAQWQELYAEEDAFWSEKKLYQRALEFSGGELREKLEAAPDGLLKALKQRREEAEAAEAAERERICAAYREHLQKAEQEAARKLEEAKKRQEQDLLEKERQKQATYEEACRKQEAATATAELVTAQQMFTGLGKYRDSLAHVRACADKIEALRKADLIEYERKQQQLRKKRKLRALIASACVLAAAVLTVLTVYVIIPNVKYSSAEKLLEAGDYDNAISAFSKLDGFRDAPDRIKEAEAAKLEEQNAEKYAQAEKLFQEGDYAKAADLFQNLGDYKDAKSRADEAKFSHADALAESGELEEALSAFQALGEYENTQSKVEELRAALYEKAEKLASEGRKAHAAFLYNLVEGYKDANVRRGTLWYEAGVRKTIDMGPYNAASIQSDGTVLAAGSDNHEKQKNVSRWKNIAAVSVGRYHIVGIKEDGTVVAQGSNDYGESNVSEWSNIIAIATGFDHTVGLRSDGTVVATGSNEAGQCNVWEWSDIIAVAAGENHTIGLRSDGTVVSTFEETGDNFTDIVGISAGRYYLETLGLKADGTVVSTFDKRSMSGWKDITKLSSGTHTVGLKSDGTVVAVGNFYNKAMAENSDAIYLSEWNDVVEVIAGSYTTLAKKADGTLMIAGKDRYMLDELTPKT